MPQQPSAAGDGFLRDPSSQTACLEDALRTGSAPAMRHALAAVARVRGRQRTASDAGLAADALSAMLGSDPEADIPALRDAIEAVIAGLSASHPTAPVGKTTKDRRAGGKTGRTARA